MTKKSIFRKSIFISWLVSYSSVLVIPLLFLFLSFHVNIRILQSEILRANESVLWGIQKNLDSAARSVQKLALELSLNPRIANLIIAGKRLSPEERILVIQIFKDLQASGSVNPLLDSLFVYFKKNKRIISNTDSLLEEQYRSTYYGHLSVQEWKNLIGGIYNGEFILLPRGNREQELIYSLSFPLSYQKEASANMFLKINEGLFRKYLSGSAWVEEAYLVVLDRNNHIIAATYDERPSPPVDYDDLTGNGGLLTVEADKQKYMVSYNKSAIVDWKYLSIIPLKLFWDRAGYIQSFFLIGLLLCTLLGALVSYLFLNKHYKPVKELIAAIREKAGISYEKDINEFRFIRQAMLLTFDKQEEIQERLDKQKELVKTNLLNRLLRGTFDLGIPQNEAFSYLEFEPAGNHFAVLLLVIEDFSDFLDRSETLNPSEQLKLVRYVVERGFEDTLNPTAVTLFSEIDQVLACILNLKKPDNLDLTKITQKAQRRLAERFGIHITISLGGIHETVSGISLSYSEATQALEYRFIAGADQVISCHEIPSGPAGDYYYPLAEEQRLFNYIRTGDAASAAALVERIYSHNISNKRVSVEMMKCLMFNLASTMIKVIDDINSSFSLGQFPLRNTVTELLSNDSAEKIKDSLLALVNSLGAYVREQEQENCPPLIKKVEEYVKTHFTDRNLCIATIADHFSISPDYLSKMFKKQTSRGILDLLNSARLSQARKLLAESRLSLGAIATRIGYSNTGTFLRIFKKQQGVTPGEYRKILKQS